MCPIVRSIVATRARGEGAAHEYSDQLKPGSVGRKLQYTIFTTVGFEFFSCGGEVAMVERIFGMGRNLGGARDYYALPFFVH